MPLFIQLLNVKTVTILYDNFCAYHLAWYFELHGTARWKRAQEKHLTLGQKSIYLRRGTGSFSLRHCRIKSLIKVYANVFPLVLQYDNPRIECN